MMTTIVGEILAQATPAATKGGVATPGGQLPEAGVSVPLVILTLVSLALIIFGVTRFFSAFKKF